MPAIKRKVKAEEKAKVIAVAPCNDKNCPWHGSLRVRGRRFKGYIKKIVGNRAVIEWQRLIFYPKYERYARAKSKVHAHIPSCIAAKIRAGDHVQIAECRPISKIKHFVVLRKVKEEK